MTAFLLGLLIGMLVPVALLILLAWLLLRSGNKAAVAKLLHCLALVLAGKPRAPEPSLNGKPEEAGKP